MKRQKRNYSLRPGYRTRVVDYLGYRITLRYPVHGPCSSDGEYDIRAIDKRHRNRFWAFCGGPGSEILSRAKHDVLSYYTARLRAGDERRELACRHGMEAEK